MFNETILREANIEYEQALKRFAGKQELYQKYLKNFLTDTHFQEAKTAYQNMEYHIVMETAHALKGISGTLGIMNLYESASKVVESIRKNENEGLDEFMADMEREYMTACKVVNQITQPQT